MEPTTAKEDHSVDILELLRKLRSAVFEESDEELALAVGRPTEQIAGWLSGDEEIDEDAEVKIRGLADERL